jgi:hypothetical protein
MSRKRTFLVAVDVLDPSFDRRRMVDLVRTDPSIKGWWNHVPGCFLLDTVLNADELTDRVRTASQDARLLVMEVNPSASEGWLPERSWDWIRRHETEHADS